MIGLLLPLAFAATPLSTLEHCIEKSDRPCVSALLATSPKEASAEYWAAAARGQLLLGKRQDAIAAINRAVDQKPGDFDLLMEQGWVYQRSGDQVAAIRCFVNAGQIQPRTPAVFYELGMSFFLVPEFDRAVTHFTRVLELDAKQDKAEFMLGILDVLKNDNAAAKVHFRTRAGDGTRECALSAALWRPLLMQMNQAEDCAGEKACRRRKTNRDFGSNPLTRFNLGRVYRQMGRLPDADARAGGRRSG